MSLAGFLELVLASVTSGRSRECYWYRLFSTEKCRLLVRCRQVLSTRCKWCRSPAMRAGSPLSYQQPFSSCCFHFRCFFSAEITTQALDVSGLHGERHSKALPTRFVT